MKDLRFRCWDGRLKLMLKVTSLMWKEDGLWACCDGQVDPWDKLVLNTAVKPLMQFTGLFDSKGKEIWEGDLIESTFIEYPRVRTMGKVVYDPEHCLFGSENLVGVTPLYKLHKISVIGDIYTTPELLKERK
jgi:uncharacterized phage protein (TIGR01671 family)